MLNPAHHRNLKEAFEARQVGDYGIHKEISTSKAAEVIQWGKEFLTDAELFLKENKTLNE